MSDAPYADIAHCVFDAYGTLLDLESATHGATAKIGAEKEKALNALWRRKQLDYTWLRSLMGHYDDFWRVTGEALDHAMDALDVADPSLRAELMQNYLGLRAFDDAAPTLQALSDAGKRRVVLSNGAPSMLTSSITQGSCGGLIDAILSADSVQVFKPDPRVYQLACDRLNAEPGEICFFSSNGWDIAGASEFGFHTIWVNRAGATPERLPKGPTHTLPDLASAKPLFGL
ncbi:MAG: haloacid dehalogenase type II [Pseudomonadota bacterium]